MDYRAASNTRTYSLLLLMLFFLVTLGKYYLYIGFALKPYMLFLTILLVLYITSFRFQKLQLFEIALFFFFLVYMFSGVVSIYTSSSLRMTLGILIYLGFYLIMKGIIQQFGIKALENSLAYAGILFNLVSLGLYFLGIKSNGYSLTGDGVIYYGTWFDRDYPRLIGLLEDPNYFVFYNTIFLTYFLCNRGSLRNNIGLLLCIFTSLLTFSRGGLLVIAIIFILYFLLSHPINQFKLLLISVLIFLTAWGAAYLLQFNFLEILQSRFMDFSRDGGSGRFELWERAWEFFADHMLFGIGAHNFIDYNSFVYGDKLVVHNTFLEVLTESGLAGMVAYILFILFVFVQIFYAGLHRKSPYLLFALLAFLLQMMFLTLIINDMFLLYLAILSTYLQQEKRNPERDQGGAFT